MSRARTSAASKKSPPAEPRRITPAELRAIVGDPDELAKGTRLLDDGLLEHLARFENRIYAEARGSGPAPYRVAVAFFEAEPAEGEAADAPKRLRLRPRCTCPAARTRPVCKHGAALLVAWARAPEAFATADVPPAGAPGERKRGVKRGRTARLDLMKRGVAQVETLVRELAVAGVASASLERQRGVRVLGESLRESKLRRLSARTLDLADLFDKSSSKGASLDPVAYAEILVDLLLTSRKIARHTAGEPLDDRHVEELVGKTWRANERAAVEGLDLLEYAYLVKTTSDDFVIRESRLVDVSTGQHFSEKQIVPAFMARLTEPKASRAGAVHRGVRGSLYPGYPPRRLEINDLGDAGAVDDVALASLVANATPDVRAALAALQQHRRDVFAPDRFPIAVRVDALVARGDRLQAVDAEGHALHLPVSAELEERIGGALRGASLSLLLGDVGVDAALPTLFPFAAVLSSPRGSSLELLVGGEPSKRRGRAPVPVVMGWADAAREAGASPASIALGEVREELASALVDGLAALGPRVASPLAARLSDLGLEPQAAMLSGLVARADPFERVDAFVKLYQVLSTALLRLATALTVDRGGLSRVPTFESVFVTRPHDSRTPVEIARGVADGSLNRYEAATLAASFYAAMPKDELVANAYLLAADGTAAPFVAAELAARGEAGLTTAERLLKQARGRTAKATAVRALTLVGSDAARTELALIAKRDDVGLAARARDALEAFAATSGHDEEVAGRRAARGERLSLLAEELAEAKAAPDRAQALRELVALGDLRVLPLLRRALASDPSRDVREEAAAGLALYVDTDVAGPMIRALAARGEQDKEAAVAARVLGVLGDARAAEELAAAFAEGFKPGVTGEALAALGAPAVVALIRRVLAAPDLAQRKAIDRVFDAVSGDVLAALLYARVEAMDADAITLAGGAMVRLASRSPFARAAVGRAVLERLDRLTLDLPDLARAARKAASS